MLKQLLDLVGTSNYKLIYTVLIFSLFTSLLEVLSISILTPATNYLIYPDQAIILPKFLSIFNGFLDESDNILLITGLIVLITGLFRILNSKLLLNSTAKIGTSLSVRTFDSLIHHDYSYFVKKSSSQVINDMTINVRVCIESIRALVTLVTSTVMSLAISIALLYVNPALTLGIIAIMSLFYYLIYFKTKAKMQSNLRQVNSYLDKHISIIQQSFASIKEIIIEKKYDNLIQDYQYTDKFLRVKVSQNNFISTIPRFIIETIFLTIFFFYFYQVNVSNPQSSTLDVGQASAFLYAFLRLLPTTQLVFNSKATITANSNSFERVRRILHSNLKKEPYQPFDNLKTGYTEKLQKLDLHKVCISYYGDKDIIDNVSFTINPNDFVEISGPSGCGKSSLLDAISGLVELRSGYILFNGKKISSNIDFYHDAVTYIPQTSYLLNDTIRNNLTERSAGITDAKIKMYLRITESLEFVNSFPMGLDHNLSENAKNLSGGQRQRLILTRALIREKPLILLDESLSAIDNITALKILTNIRNMKQFTLIMVNHNSYLSEMFNSKLTLN